MHGSIVLSTVRFVSSFDCTTDAIRTEESFGSLTFLAELVHPAIISIYWGGGSSCREWFTVPCAYKKW